MHLDGPYNETISRYHERKQLVSSCFEQLNMYDQSHVEGMRLVTKSRIRRTKCGKKQQLRLPGMRGGIRELRNTHFPLILSVGKEGKGWKRKMVRRDQSAEHLASLLGTELSYQTRKS